MENKISIISLIPQFVVADDFIRNEKNLKKKIKLWDDFYGKPNKEILVPYFRWADKKYGLQFFDKYSKYYDLDQILKNEKWVIDNAQKIIGKIEKTLEFPFKYISIVLNVGFPNQTNGFVDVYKNKWTVYMNLENYKDFETLRVFFTHELLHSFELQYNSKVYYWEKNKKHIFSNTLLLEGFASYFTAKALKINSGLALWGNYYSKDKRQKFMNWHQKNRSRIFKDVAEIVKSEKQNSIPKYSHQLFGGDPPKGYPYIRSGYWIGMEFIDYLIKTRNMDVGGILKLEPNKLRLEILSFAKENIR